MITFILNSLWFLFSIILLWMGMDIIWGSNFIFWWMIRYIPNLNTYISNFLWGLLLISSLIIWIISWIYEQISIEYIAKWWWFKFMGRILAQSLSFLILYFFIFRPFLEAKSITTYDLFCYLIVLLFILRKNIVYSEYIKTINN